MKIKQSKKLIAAIIVSALIIWGGLYLVKQQSSKASETLAESVESADMIAEFVKDDGQPLPARLTMVISGENFDAVNGDLQAQDLPIGRNPVSAIFGTFDKSEYEVVLNGSKISEIILDYDLNNNIFTDNSKLTLRQTKAAEKPELSDKTELPVTINSLTLQNNNQTIQNAGSNIYKGDILTFNIDAKVLGTTEYLQGNPVINYAYCNGLAKQFLGWARQDTIKQADGTYRAEIDTLNPPPGECFYYYIEARSIDGSTVLLPDGGVDNPYVVNIELANRPTSKVTGKVINKKNGQPVEKAKVTFINTSTNQTFIDQETDGSGMYIIENVPYDELTNGTKYNAIVEKGGYYQSKTTYNSTTGKGKYILINKPLVEVQTAKLTPMSPKQATIAGKIVSSMGGPKNYTVKIHTDILKDGESINNISGIATAKTNQSDGSFTFSNVTLDPTKDYYIIAEGCSSTSYHGRTDNAAPKLPAGGVYSSNYDVPVNLSVDAVYCSSL